LNNSSDVIRRSVVAGMALADKVFVLGTSHKRKLVDFGLDESNIRIFVMGVPALKPEHVLKKAPQAQIKVLFAGEMSLRKGLDKLLDALNDSSLANFYLTVAGSGSIAYWKGYPSSLELNERLNFLGLVDLDTIHQLLFESDILILPSQAEGLPVSVMEAFSSGVAVVCTSVGSLDEYLKRSSKCDNHRVKFS